MARLRREGARREGAVGTVGITHAAEYTENAGASSTWAARCRARVAPDPRHTGGVDSPNGMRTHFWWRPGWAPDRPYLTWHVLPDADLIAQVGALQDRLAGIGNLAVVAPDRLHVTGPGVGFADTLPSDRVAAMVAAAGRALAGLPAFASRVGGPAVADAAVYLPVDATHLTGVRHALRDAMRTAGLEPPGADDARYRPHLTLAYATGPGSRREVAERLAGVPWSGADCRVGAAHLLALRMTPPTYDWRVRAVVPLG